MAFVGACAVVYETEWLIDQEFGDELYANTPSLHPPQWSKDGLKMIISQGQGSYLVDLSDGGVTLKDVVVKEKWDENYAVISPDGSLLAISSWRQDGDEDVFGIGVSNPDGSDYRNLTRSRNDQYLWGWSPDGDRLSFTSFKRSRDGSRSFSLYTMTPDGSSPRKLVDQGPVGHPEWSPDGQRIAFLRGSHIYVVDRNGSNLSKLVEADSPPAWSPDGRSIAFLRGDNRDSLFVINADGSGLRKIVDIDPIFGQTTGWVGIPYLSWSSDGSEILLQGHPLIRVMVDGAASHGGGSPYAVFIGPEDWREAVASWSPDGSRIAVSIPYRDRYWANDGDVIFFTMARDGYDKRVLVMVTAYGEAYAVPNEPWEGEWVWQTP